MKRIVKEKKIMDIWKALSQNNLNINYGVVFPVNGGPSSLSEFVNILNINPFFIGRFGADF